MTKDEALAGESVTWGVDWSNVGDIPCVSIIKRLPDGGIEVLAVEYGPPPRPWVGLTDGELFEIMDKANTRYQAVQMTQAKLRELNELQIDPNKWAFDNGLEST